MKTLNLKNRYQANATLISNAFIDQYMGRANGEFVKVYLLLLRHLNDPASILTVSAIADCLDHTERDVLRAFRYWEAEGLLTLEKDADGRIIGIAIEPVGLEQSPDSDENALAAASPISVKQAATAAKPASKSAVKPAEPTKKPAPATPVAAAPGTGTRAAAAKKMDPAEATFRKRELKSLYFIAEQYLGKTLTKTDIDAISYFYEKLEMPADLIEYLIETCVENNHKSIHYIQKVALSWHDEGIRSVDAARRRAKTYSHACYTVLNAFGIKNRGPADSELCFIRKWTNDMGFALDLVQEACNRTISATHQPSFEYADTILTRWHKAGVHSLNDVTALDESFQKEQKAKRAAAIAAQAKSQTKNMNNFERRSYDMESLEERLLNNN